MLRVGLVSLFFESVALELHILSIDNDPFIEWMARHDVFETSHESELVFVDLLDVANGGCAPFVLTVVLENERIHNFAKVLFEDMIHVHCRLLLEWSYLRGEHHVRVHLDKFSSSFVLREKHRLNFLIFANHCVFETLQLFKICLLGSSLLGLR